MIEDSAFREAGAKIVEGPEAVFGEADIIAKVQRPIKNAELGKHEARMMREEQILISLLQPHENPELIQLLIEKNITSFSMNLIPRISRAQGMDVLSSQATVAGYKAVLIGAGSLGKFFPMLTTAAGTLAPAKVLVLGAGAALHGFVPESVIADNLGEGQWWSVPGAVLLGIPLYANASGVIPAVESLLDKGLPVGTALAFMMSVVAASLPEFMLFS